MAGKSNVINKDQAVQQTMAMTLKTNEALLYLKQQGFEMSERTYRRQKSKLLSAKNVNAWLNSHTQAKFASNHRQMLAKIEYHIETLNRQFTLEAQKPDFVPNRKGTKDKDGKVIMVDNPAKKKFLMLSLQKRIQETIDFYAKMNLGAPVIANVMEKLNPNKTREMTEKDLLNGWITK
jgi:hypothetical protein